MPASRREGALLELKRRLEMIRNPDYPAEGSSPFWTNPGAVLLGEAPTMGSEGDPQFAIAIIVGGSTDQQQGVSERYISKLRVSVQAHVALSVEDAWLVVERMLADIKRAVEGDADLTLGGWCSTQPPGIVRTGSNAAPREDGSMSVGASVDYEFSFDDLWGRP